MARLAARSRTGVGSADMCSCLGLDIAWSAGLGEGRAREIAEGGAILRVGKASLERPELILRVGVRLIILSFSGIRRTILGGRSRESEEAFASGAFLA